jgi:hypothetical protein
MRSPWKISEADAAARVSDLRPLRESQTPHLHYGIVTVVLLGLVGLTGYFYGGQELRDLIKAAAIFFGSLLILAGVSWACEPSGGGRAK